MSINKCPISLKEIITPIYCIKTSMIYEKTEIDKVIETTGQCPITGVEISHDDLIEIKKPPIAIASNQPDISFYNIINRLKTEYDLLVYEKYSLTNELNKITLDLNDKLSKNEAAIMVIARLIQERDSAVDLLNEYQQKQQNA